MQFTEFFYILPAPGFGAAILIYMLSIQDFRLCRNRLCCQLLFSDIIEKRKMKLLAVPIFDIKRIS